MPRKFDINSGNKKQDLKKTVKNFNSRLKMAEKKNVKNIILPQPASAKDLTAGITSQKQYDDIMSYLKSFNSKSLKETVKVGKNKNIELTKWEYDKSKRELTAINKERRELMKKEDIKKGIIGTAKTQNLRPIKNTLNQAVKREHVEGYLKKIDYLGNPNQKNIRNQNYKKHYIIALKNYTGRTSAPLRRVIKNIPADVLAQAYYDDPLLQVQYVSDPVDVLTIISNISSHWKEWIEDNYSNKNIEWKNNFLKAYTKEKFE